jgi:hypothetical protein
MATDRARVRAIVQQALDRNSPPGDVSTRLDRAWRPANWQREAPGGVNCGNADPAAAGHHLFVRRGESVPGLEYAPLSYGLR